jgi:hypothetical protein
VAINLPSQRRGNSRGGALADAFRARAALIQPAAEGGDLRLPLVAEGPDQHLLIDVRCASLVSDFAGPASAVVASAISSMSMHPRNASTTPGG